MPRDWPVLPHDPVGGQMPGERIRRARPYEAQVAAAWSDRRGGYQGADVETRPVNVELLIAEAECDPAVRVVDYLRSHDVTVETDRAIPVADGDHHVVEAYMS